jgi:ankyrin repeat protein
VRLGEPAEISPSDLLDLLELSEDSLVEIWVRTYEQMKPYAADCPRSGAKLIHFISRYGLTKLASCLLQDCGEIGALVNMQDRWGRTPLSWAAQNGNEAVVKLLLDMGKVDMAAEDVCGLTASQFADFNHHKRIDDY